MVKENTLILILSLLAVLFFGVWIYKSYNKKQYDPKVWHVPMTYEEPKVEPMDLTVTV